MRDSVVSTIIGVVILFGAGLRAAEPIAGDSPPLRMIVMDPLSLPLSCTCVEGTGQRRYDMLAEFLSEKLAREVSVTFEESVGLAARRMDGPADLIAGKRGVIEMDAKSEKIAVRPLADLTGLDGATGLEGVFLVRKDDPATKLEDLKGRVIAVGPQEDTETNAAAREAIEAAGLTDEVEFKVAGSIDSAALALNDGEADVAVVSAFMPKMLEGCGKIEKGTVRPLAKTEPVPFVTVYATATVSHREEEAVREALYAVAGKEELLAVMESSKGFVAPVSSAAGEGGSWTDWRGENRAGISDQIPDVLPAEPRRVWTTALSGPAMAGVAVTDRFVIVPDKDTDFKTDIFRCLEVVTGRELWRLEYAADTDMDYSNAPRATPVVRDGLVYLQGALGDLHCVEIATGKVVWHRNIFTDFGAELLTWGSSCAPLVFDDKIVINPGAHEASLVALDRRTGEVLWETPGHPAAYASFVIGTFGGLRQIIGYDTASLGGWDPESGERLWEFIPPDATDFNVTTPVILGERILLATENNATRVYGFEADGKLNPEPILVNDDLAPDTCTPVWINDRVYASAYGEMFCLDLNNNLETVWSVQDDMFYDHTNVMAGNGRVLVWTMSGDLLLLNAEPGADAYEVISHDRPFGDKTLDSMAHPAIVGNRIYLRSKDALACILLD